MKMQGMLDLIKKDSEKGFGDLIEKCTTCPCA